MDWRWRVVIAVVLAGLLFGSFVHYDATYDSKWPYTENGNLVTAYDDHVGEQTLLFGTVLESDGTTMQIRVESDIRPFDVTVTNASQTADPGGVVQVFGTLQPSPQTVAAENVVVVNQAGSSNLYKYAVSAVGALLILVLFFRYWTVDTDVWAFEVRDDG